MNDKKLKAIIFYNCCIIIALLLLLCSCNPLRHVNTEGLAHDGEKVYYHQEHVASLSSVELSWDDGKIVREFTFILTDAKYNDLALNIIKFMRDHDKHVEVEVELKR